RDDGAPARALVQDRRIGGRHGGAASAEARAPGRGDRPHRSVPRRRRQPHDHAAVDHRRCRALLTMQLDIGLNPYGLTYHLGMQGAGTPRANPAPAGLEGFLALAAELRAKVLEIWQGWLTPLDDAQLAALAQRL